MLDFEGNMSESCWRSKHKVVFEDQYDEMTNLTSNMALFCASEWEANINANMSAAFALPPSIEQH